jgi:hypothetical protein
MTVTRAGRTARSAGRDAAYSRSLQWLARGGMVARGVIYMLIGLLAVQIAFGSDGKQADTSGALQAVAKHPGGIVVLWLLVVGFAGLPYGGSPKLRTGRPAPMAAQRASGWHRWRARSCTPSSAAASSASYSVPATRPWAAPDVTGYAVSTGHHMTEEAPGELSAILVDFLSGR